MILKENRDRLDLELDEMLRDLERYEQSAVWHTRMALEHRTRAECVKIAIDNVRQQLKRLTGSHLCRREMAEAACPRRRASAEGGAA